MPHLPITAGAVAFALSGFALTGPAQAVSPLPFNDVASLAIPVVDEETAVEEMERPDEVPAGSQEEAAPKSAAPEAPAEGKGDVEEGELQKMFPETNWPKK
jgi:hypothetical protein